MSAWPADHSIGVFLCVDDQMRPVGTARTGADVPHLLRHLAGAWEAYGSLPIPETQQADVYFADLLWDGLPVSP